MPNYGIMRVEKRRRSALYGLEIEANRSLEKHIVEGREFARSDINWDLTPLNVHLVKADNWGKAVTMAIRDAGVKERKNSVVLIDGFYGASPEWFQDKPLNVIIEYFKDCLAFHEREYGKLLNAVIHFDEATPHLAVASVALKYDELSGFYELGRLAMDEDHNVKNLTSWFVAQGIKRLRKEVNVRAIISYADSDFHYGGIYQALNFKYYGLTAKKKDFWIEQEDGTYVKHTRGKTVGIKGEWRPRLQKHRYTIVYDKSLTPNWVEAPYPKAAH